MNLKSILRYPLVVMFVMIIIMMPLLVACGGSSSTPTPTVAPTATRTVARTATAVPTATAAPTATMARTTTAVPTATAAPTATPTATPTQEPIKIGALGSWSGPAGTTGVSMIDPGIALITDQLTKQGGILGGRSLKFIKYDDGSTTAGDVAGFTKLALQDKVSAIVLGGGSPAQGQASADQAESLKIPFFDWDPVPTDLTNYHYTIRCVMPNASDTVGVVADFVLSKLKPKSVGILYANVTDVHTRADLLQGRLKSAGVNIVYEEFAPTDTQDFSPYLTKIKYSNPDVLISDSGGNLDWYTSIFTQIAGLGAWGDIKFVSASGGSSGPALKKPGAEGTYHWVMWMPGLPYPGAKIFEQAVMDALGRPATAIDVYAYYTLWVTVKAIELAGSDDPAKIAQAARSGQLYWDSPGGPFTIKPDGSHTNKGLMAQFTGGKLVLVQ